MAKVRIYQDIDCCLNASYNARAWRTKDDDVDAGYCHGYVSPRHDDYGGYRGGTQMVKYKMEWNSRLIDAYNSMDIELVWATTWREDAHAVGTLMGLKHVGRVLHPLSGRTTFPSLEWKLAAILSEQQSNPSPFIWVEDEIPHLSHWEREALSEFGGLLIAPDPNLGVSPAQVEEIREYISAH